MLLYGIMIAWNGGNLLISYSSTYIVNRQLMFDLYLGAEAGLL